MLKPSSRIIQRHFNKARQANDPYYKVAIGPDITTWYLMIHSIEGSQKEYVGGQYLFRLEITDGFPIDPPKIFPMTPNGLYDITGNVCVDKGEHHASDYPAALGLAGFSQLIISGLLGWEHMKEGVRLIDTTVDAKKTLAASSVAYNREHYSDILALFENQQR